MGRQHSSPAYRIRQGESVVALVWANVAIDLAGNGRIVYDDGDEDDFSFDKFTTGTARASQLVKTNRIARINGFVTEGILTHISGALLRGQIYGQMAISGNPNTGGPFRQDLARGYIYPGSPLDLGVFREPGPADGQGQRRSVVTADPAAGSEVAAQAVPAGAIWRILSYSVQLVQGITQTPLPTLKLRFAATDIIAQIPITTTAIGASSTAQLTWYLSGVQSSFTAVVGDEFHTAPLPNLFMFPTDDVLTATDGIGANTNYGAANVEVEEWVIPT